MTRRTIEPTFRAVLTWTHGAQDALVDGLAVAHYQDLDAGPQTVRVRSAARVPPGLLREIERDILAAAQGPDVAVEVAPRPPRRGRRKVKP